MTSAYYHHCRSNSSACHRSKTNGVFLIFLTLPLPPEKLKLTAGDATVMIDMKQWSQSSLEELELSYALIKNHQAIGRMLKLRKLSAFMIQDLRDLTFLNNSPIQELSLAAGESARSQKNNLIHLEGTQLPQLTKLSVPASQLTSLTGIANMPQLTSLSLLDISHPLDYAVLNSVPLRELILSTRRPRHNQGRAVKIDLAPLASISTLRSLRFLSVAAHPELAAIQDIPHLKTLAISIYGPSQVIGDLANPEVTYLNIGGNISLQGIEGFSKLKHLAINSPQGISNWQILLDHPGSFVVTDRYKRSLNIKRLAAEEAKAKESTDAEP